MIIGYTTGVFDLFHIGHLNILKRAKSQCDYLIVGVTVDELVSYKGKHAFIPFSERIAIVEAIKYVDRAVPQTSMDKMEAWKKYHFQKMFVALVNLDYKLYFLLTIFLYLFVYYYLQLTNTYFLILNLVLIHL